MQIHYWESYLTKMPIACAWHVNNSILAAYCLCHSLTDEYGEKTVILFSSHGCLLHRVKLLHCIVAFFIHKCFLLLSVTNMTTLFISIYFWFHLLIQIPFPFWQKSRKITYGESLPKNSLMNAYKWSKKYPKCPKVSQKRKQKNWAIVNY